MHTSTLSHLSPIDQRTQAVLLSRRGLPLFGYVYDNVNRRHLPDPVRFPIVKRLFELTAAGVKMRFIYQELSAMEGFTTIARGSRGGRPIPRQNLYAMLRDPFYAGMVEWEGRLYEGIHEAVVSWPIFLAVNRPQLRQSTTNQHHHDFEQEVVDEVVPHNSVHNKVQCPM